MAKEPAQRFQTAEEVADLLMRCLAHVQQPLAVPLPSDPILQVSLPIRHRPRRRVALLAMLVLLMGAISLLWWNPGPARHSETSTGNTKSEEAGGSPTYDWAGGATDDVSRQIADAQQRAAEIEASLRHSDSSDRDQLAGLVHDLSMRAQSLEKELAPGKVATSATPGQQPLSNPNDRR